MHGEVPQEANERHCGAEGNVFCLLPWDAQFVRQGIDVGHAVGVFAVFFRSVCNKRGGVVGWGGAGARAEEFTFQRPGRGLG